MSHLFLTQEEIEAKKLAGEARLIIDPEPRFLVTFKSPPPGLSFFHYEHVRATQVHAGDILEISEDDNKVVKDVWHKQNRSRHSGWTEGVGGVMIELESGQNLVLHNGDEKVWVLRR